MSRIIMADETMAEIDSDVVTALDIEGEITRICLLSEDELKLAKGSSKLSGVSLAVVKQMSIHLQLNRSFNKSTLLDNIRRKRKRVEDLAAVHSAEAEAEESDEESQRFMSNQNTFARLCNIILDHPDAIVRSALLASKYALQNKETNQNQPIFVLTCSKFNDSAYNSGGLVSEHPELMNAKVDPEKHNTGKISAKQVFKLFNSTIRQYAPISIKFTASGKHNQHDFFNYCHGNLNVLYLHLKLEKLGNPELNSYCNEGADLEGN